MAATVVLSVGHQWAIGGSRPPVGHQGHMWWLTQVSYEIGTAWRKYSPAVFEMRGGGGGGG